jgi:flagellar biogenesis protein FliO
MSDIYRQFAGVLLVLALLAAMVWLAKRRGLARWSFPSPGGARLVTVLERILLTPQHTLHVLMVGGRKLLLTSSPGSCQLITELQEHQETAGVEKAQ